MGIVLDIILVAIVLITAVISAKRGFVRTAIEVVGFIAVILLILPLSRGAADFIYDKAIEPSVVSKVESAVSATDQKISDAVVSALPDFVEKNLGKFGIDEQKLVSDIGIMGQNSEEITAYISNDILQPIVTGILGALLSIILFIAAVFLVKILAKLLNKVFSFSLVGKINSTLGFAVGALKGAIFAIIGCLLVTFIASMGANFFVFSASAMENSAVYKFICSVIDMNLFKL